MLNLKKGLALVLAAATAFTFAPVANLGNAVQAEAADTNSFTYDISTSKFTDGEGTQNTSATTGGDQLDKAGSWVVTVDDTTAPIKVQFGTDSTAFYVDKDAKNNARNVIAPGDVTFSYAADANHFAQNKKYTFHFKKVIDFGNTTVTNGTAQLTPTDYDLTRDLAKSFDVVIEIKNAVAPKFGTWTPGVAARTETNNSKTYLLSYKGEGTIATIESLANLADTWTADNEDNLTFSLTNNDGYVTVSDKDSHGNKLVKGQYRLIGNIPGTTTVTASLKAKNDVTLTKSGSPATTLKYKAGATITTKDFTFEVASRSNIKDITWEDAKTPIIGKTAYTHEAPEGYTDTYFSAHFQSKDSVDLDTVLTKSTKLNVNAAGALSFTSSAPSIASVSQDGTITANKEGTATIHINAAAAGLYGADQTDVTVVVSKTAQDIIDTTSNGAVVNADKQLDLDKSDSTGAGAVKSAKIDAVSRAGSAVTFTLVSDNNSTAAGDSQIATVAADGTVKAGTKAGTVYVLASTPAKGSISAGQKWIKVVVNALPAAQINADDITLDLGSNKTKTIAATVTGNANAVFTYDLADSSDNVVDLRRDVVTAKRYGSTSIVIGTPATSSYRYTTKTIGVHVVGNVSKSVSDLKVASSALTVKVGDTASAGASTTASGAAITYTSSDTDVATVAADGTITAVAPGTAVVTVKAAETDTVNAGTATIVVTVPSNPQKVTGVKVSNKKGAYVSVKWTSQGGNVNYRIYKKVGNGKWIGKNVAGSKTTLKVKKGAKVQVKVKAYVKDSTGKTTWGPKATKAKTFKTDKK